MKRFYLVKFCFSSTELTMVLVIQNFAIFLHECIARLKEHDAIQLRFSSLLQCFVFVKMKSCCLSVNAGNINNARSLCSMKNSETKQQKLSFVPRQTTTNVKKYEKKAGWNFCADCGISFEQLLAVVCV